MRDSVLYLREPQEATCSTSYYRSGIRGKILKMFNNGHEVDAVKLAIKEDTGFIDENLQYLVINGFDVNELVKHCKTWTILENLDFLLDNDVDLSLLKEANEVLKKTDTLMKTVITIQETKETEIDDEDCYSGLSLLESLMRSSRISTDYYELGRVKIRDLFMAGKKDEAFSLAMQYVDPANADIKIIQKVIHRYKLDEKAERIVISAVKYASR